MKDPEVDATADPSISVKLINYSLFQVKHRVDRPVVPYFHISNFDPPGRSITTRQLQIRKI